MKNKGWYSWNNLVWWAQITTAFLWAALIVSLWFGWTAGSIAEVAPGNDDVVGMIVLLTSGCCGISWIFGLVPIAICFWLLRGPQ